MRSTTLSPAWVKNVYSLCVDGVLKGVYSYTGTNFNYTNPVVGRVQNPLFTHSLDSFTPTLYTRIFTSLSLLTTGLYTQSTPPTIIKKKKI